MPCDFPFVWNVVSGTNEERKKERTSKLLHEFKGQTTTTIIIIKEVRNVFVYVCVRVICVLFFSMGFCDSVATAVIVHVHCSHCCCYQVYGWV